MTPDEDNVQEQADLGEVLAESSPVEPDPLKLEFYCALKPVRAPDCEPAKDFIIP